MRRGTAAIGSAVFFVAAPGVVVGIVPWWLTGWDHRFDWPLAVRVAGLVMLVLGVTGLVQAFVRFVVEGFGTPSPIAPPSAWSSADGTATCGTRCTSRW